MIIGNGLVAQAFGKYKDIGAIMIFASGVSNSKEVDEKAYERETLLLKNTLSKYNEKVIVYFSTTSIYDKELRSSQYCVHKLNMEKIIRDSSIDYYIFRLSEVVGNTNNKYQIVNYFYNAIKNNEPFTLWKKACRRLIDVEDVYFLCDFLICNEKYINGTYNITTSQRTNVTEIVKILEQILNVKSKAEVENKGNCYNIQKKCIYDILKDKKEFEYIWEKNYVNKLLIKYFTKKKEGN